MCVKSIRILEIFTEIAYFCVTMKNKTIYKFYFRDIIKKETLLYGK